MLFVCCLLWLIQKIATQLTDVLYYLKRVKGGVSSEGEEWKGNMSGVEGRSRTVRSVECGVRSEGEEWKGNMSEGEGRSRTVWSVECGVWSEECGVRSMEWSNECGVRGEEWREECGISAKCRVRSGVGSNKRRVERGGRGLLYTPQNN